MNKNYVIAPQTEIELFILNLQIDMKNQLTFNNLQEQTNYFNSLPSYTISESTFQRNDFTVRIPLPFDEAIKYTYCRYKNNDKYYYAYLTNMTYSSNEVSIATLVTDVWQTYQFDIELGVSFIEREHVRDDTIGKHTIEEGLETGEYTVIKYEYASETFSFQDNEGYYICLESMVNPKTLSEQIGGISNGLPSAISKFLYMNNQEGVKELQNDIQAIMGLSLENSKNAIQNVYLVHPLAIGNTSTLPITNGMLINDLTPNSSYLMSDTITYFKSNKGETYTPVNKKLLTYPYCYFGVTNGSTEMNIYRQEFFKDLMFDSIIHGVVCAGNSIRLYPLNYKGLDLENLPPHSSFDKRVSFNAEGLTLGKLPILNWAGDTYTAWLVNNGLIQRANIGKMQNEITKAEWNNINNGVSLNPLNWLRAGTTGRVTSETMKGNLHIQELENLHQQTLADLVPPSVGGNGNAGDVNTVVGYTDFCVYSMGILPEYAKIIDGYFYKYGYKVNETKQIEINTRNKFNYIKTVGANIYGDVPQTYMEAIKTMFDSGVTFWHSPSTFLKYSASFNDNNIKTV